MFANSQDAAREVAIVGPEVNEGGLAFVVQFVAQRGEFRKPLAVFPDFREAGRSDRTQSAIELEPISHRQTTQRLETVPALLYSRTRPVTRIEGYC